MVLCLPYMARESPTDYRQKEDVNAWVEGKHVQMEGWFWLVDVPIPRLSEARLFMGRLVR